VGASPQLIQTIDRVLPWSYPVSMSWPDIPGLPTAATDYLQSHIAIGDVYLWNYKNSVSVTYGHMLSTL